MHKLSDLLRHAIGDSTRMPMIDKVERFLDTRQNKRIGTSAAMWFAWKIAEGRLRGIISAARKADTYNKQYGAAKEGVKP